MDRILRRNFLLLGLLLFQFSCAALARRYIVPNDSNVLNTYEYNQTAALYPQNIEVLVWNIYKASKDDFFKDWLRFGVDKDIILTQEAWQSQDYLNSLPRLGMAQAIMARSWLDSRENKTGTGVMTLSRARSKRTTWLRSPGREPIVRTPKMSLITVYPIAGIDESLMVINIHALNFTSVNSFKRTLSQTKSFIENHRGPILFAGDFNTHINARYTFMQKFFRDLNFEQVVFYPDHRFRILGRYLDFTFVRGLKVQSAEAPESAGSDHNPLLMTFSLF